MTYARMDFRLPPRGIVLVTGDNGAGKSAILEAICYGITGTTIRPLNRGWHPLQEGGWVNVRTHIGDGKATLIVDARRGEGTRRAPTPPQFGAKEVFLYGHVFGGEIDRRFAILGDAERKRLLESVLGLGALDKAQEIAREAYRQVDAEKSSLEAKLSVRESDLGSLLEELKTARSESESKYRAILRDLKELRGGRLSEINTHIASVAKVVEILGGRARAARQRKAELQTYAKPLPEECPTCKRPWPGSKKLRAEYSRKRAEYRSAWEKAQTLEKHLSDLQIEHSTLLTKRDSILHRIGSLESELKAESYGKAATLAEQVSQMRARVADLKEKLKRCKRHWEIESRTVGVFAPKGVRTVLLSDAVSIYNRFANKEMVRLGSQVRFRFGVSESSDISMEIVGAGKGSYVGCSRGERNRMDIALMLGLGCLAKTAAGSAPSWAFVAFDEVFDSLDRRGVEAMIDHIVELSRRKCVLVISHSEDLLSSLPGAHHWRVKRNRGGESILEEAL